MTKTQISQPMQRDLSPEEIEKFNNRKLTADKIRQILSKVMETPTQSSKRWVWELMQNAKDIPNRFGEVSIKIELSDNFLTFSHNGDPFSLKNIMGLVQQVSSKDSTNSNDEVTGKFGTGFISTHLLSRKIAVKGFVLHNGEHKKFDIILDRSGDSSEDLIPKIKTALEHISQIEDNQLFPVVNSYEASRSELSFDTSFEYELLSEKSRKWASDGIDDLVNTLPQTLVNLEKIKTVTVVNKGVQEIYEKKEVFSKGGVTGYEVQILNKEPKRFLSYGQEGVTLAVEVSSFSPLTLVEHFGQQPNLFRDFPLIGSEKFHFPYILNGHHFNPTEDRDSILLHSEESSEAIENRQYVEDAISVAMNFTKWLIDNNAVNRHICAYTRRPELKTSWEDFSKSWYADIQSAWREQLIEMPLFETEGGVIINLKEGIIPEDGDSKDLKEEFYDIAKPIFSSESIPKKDKYFDWLKVLGPKSETAQRDNWGVKLTKDASDLAQLISSFQCKGTMLSNTELRNEEELNAWLNGFYSYIIKTQQTGLLSDYELIPNQKGNFNNLDNLRLEDAQKPIPDELLDILERLGETWRDELIDRGVNIDFNIDTLSCSDISETINNIIKEKQGYNSKTSVFLQKSDARGLLTDILKLQPENFTTENSQYKLLGFGEKLFNDDFDVSIIDNLAPFNFLPAMKLYVELINVEIQDLENLEGLQTRLLKSEEDSLFWLNQYLNLLQSNTNLRLLLEDEIRVIPNRYKEFVSYDDAQSFGTDETPLDDSLVDILYGLNNQEDWKGFLVHNGITIELNEKCKFEELSQSIEENISSIQADDIQNPGEDRIESFKSPILDLIEWIEGSNNKRLAGLYFSNFVKESKSLLFKLTVGNSNIGISSIKMLQDEASVNLLAKIQESEVSTDDLSELIDIVSELGSTQQLKQTAKELSEEKRNREFLYIVGEKVEEAIQNSLSEFIVEKVSIGAFDLKITNGDLSYFLEVKSFKNNSNFPLLFAPSQAGKVMLDESNYAICTMERPIIEANEITIDYVKDHLLFAKDLSAEFSTGVDDYSKFTEIMNNQSVSKLRVDILGDVRVQVDKNVIVDKSQDFNSLIVDIRRELTDRPQSIAV